MLLDTYSVLSFTPDPRGRLRVTWDDDTTETLPIIGWAVVVTDHVRLSDTEDLSRSEALAMQTELEPVTIMEDRATTLRDLKEFYTPKKIEIQGR